MGIHFGSREDRGISGQVKEFVIVKPRAGGRAEAVHTMCKVREGEREELVRQRMGKEDLKQERLRVRPDRGD